jgi:hypothetical protein
MKSNSMVGHLRWSDSFPDYSRLVRNVSCRCAKDASDSTWVIRGSDVDLIHDRYNQKCGGKTASGLVVALQTLPGYVEQCAGRMDRLHRIQPAYSTRGMEELP